MSYQASPAARPPRGQFKLTGRHVFFIFAAFFGVVIATNVVFVRLAVSSFPGEEVKKSYYQGLHYNDVLEARDAQRALGWSIALMEAPVAGRGSTLRLRLTDGDGAAISNAVVSARLVRPATGVGEQVLTFTSEGGGVYVSDPVPLAQGAWKLAVEAWEPEGRHPPTLPRRGSSFSERHRNR